MTLARPSARVVSQRALRNYLRQVGACRRVDPDLVTYIEREAVKRIDELALKAVEGRRREQLRRPLGMAPLRDLKLRHLDRPEAVQ